MDWYGHVRGKYWNGKVEPTILGRCTASLSVFEDTKLLIVA
jgi:hypothetical protein